MDVPHLRAAAKSRGGQAGHYLAIAQRGVVDRETRKAILRELRRRSWRRRPAARGMSSRSRASLVGELRRVAGDVPDPITDVVLVLGADAVPIADEVAGAFPDATVHLLSVWPISAKRRSQLPGNISYRHCKNIAERVAYLSAQPQPQLILERGDNTQRRKIACLRQLLPFVVPGGAYLVDGLRPRSAGRSASPEHDVSALLDTLVTLHSGGPGEGIRPQTVELAASLSAIDIGPDAAVLTKALAHQFKVRDSTANALLAARFGDQWGELLQVRKGFSWEGNATVVAHGEGPERSPRRTFEVPDRFLRRYHDVQCWPRQRLRYGDYWLPDTFRHPLHVQLTHRRLVSASADMARITHGASGTTRSSAGPFFYFDTEYPGHFGHVLTEVVARYWGWQAARELAPDVRPLVSLGYRQDGLRPFQQAVFSALGIDLDSIESFRHNECLAVGTLYAATPDLVMPQYVTPDLRAVWDAIRRGCEQTDPGPTPERLFVSRRPRPIRTCLNTDEVEQLFAGLGFEICHPEDHDFTRQVSLFHRAKVIAGFGGSGMFSTMFAPGTTVLLINADSYNAVNEELIRAVVGGDIHYFWGDSLIKQPRGSWSWDAYQSNFNFDVDRFAPEIKDVVDRAIAGA